MEEAGGLTMSSRARSKTPTMQNANRWSTKQLVVMALMCAIALLLSFIEFPLFPAASFLKLDFSLVPTMVVGFAYGAGPGLLVGLACAIAHAIITGNWVGCLMSCIVAIAFVLPAAMTYKRHRTLRGATVSLVIATICLIVGTVIANLIIDPIFYGMPFDAVAALVVPAILPFNVIKGVAISLLTALVYKSISNLIAPTEGRQKSNEQPH